MANNDIIVLNIFGLKIKTHRKKFSFKKRTINPKVKDKFETLNILLNTQNSIVRYGDGEFDLIRGNSIPFQIYNPDLKMRLTEILTSDNSNIMVGIPDVFDSLDDFNPKAKKFWKKYVRYNWENIYSIIDLNKQYYNASITKPYMDAKDKTFCKKFFADFKLLWDKKDLVIVEGEASRLGYGNDLFNNCNSIQRVLCPAKNAYEKYHEIFDFCKKLPKDKLFILALGPMATVLAYDLAQCGFRALDLGHIDIEYEWFLQKATTKIPIKNKYVNEAEHGKTITNLNDTQYQNEILADFT